MKPILLCLHGYTQNSQILRDMMLPLVSGLSNHCEPVFLDAPYLCPAHVVEEQYRSWRMSVPIGPHRSWWDPSSPLSHYGGWDSSIELISEWLNKPNPVALLGFSQGAMLTAIIAALANQRTVLPITYSILIGARKPRSEKLTTLWSPNIVTPSLHIWGTRDSLAVPGAPELAAHFHADTRRIITWDAGHQIPTQGTVAQQLLDFVAAYET